LFALVLARANPANLNFSADPHLYKAQSLATPGLIPLEYEDLLTCRSRQIKPLRTQWEGD
jgi:hypothetical protein